MNPTLKDGQKLIMKKFQKNDKLHRGDVVIIKVTLKDKEYDFIKRVIALPGEHLEIKNHKVYINGKYLEDEGSTMGEEDCVIPDDSISKSFAVSPGKPQMQSVVKLTGRLP